jgi:hypothetical protein
MIRISQMETDTGTQLGTDTQMRPDASADARWLWKGRRVYLFEVSTVSMPDTAENRKEYPLTYNQKVGMGLLTHSEASDAAQ